MDDLWATKSEDVGLVVRAVSFLDFQPICGHDPRTNVTDRQTDGQTDDMRLQDRVLSIVHRMVKKLNASRQEERKML